MNNNTNQVNNNTLPTANPTASAYNNPAYGNTSMAQYADVNYKPQAYSDNTIKDVYGLLEQRGNVPKQ